MQREASSYLDVGGCTFALARCAMMIFTPDVVRNSGRVEPDPAATTVSSTPGENP